MLSIRKLLAHRWKRHNDKRHSVGNRATARDRQRVMRFESLEEKVLLATYAVIGDFGSSGVGELAVANMVKAWNPEKILTLGDNNYEVGSAATIDANIGQYYHEYIGNYQGSYGAGSPTNRFLPVLGNHDWETAGAQPYFDYFTLPGNERYYDFVLDNVHFFALDSDPHEPHGQASTSVQALWLRDALANSQEMFNVAYFHNAPYSSREPTPIMRWPFKEWGADAVLTGHQHQYERIDVDGLPYFVNGLGGAEIIPFGTPIAGSLVRYNADFGAMRVVTGSTTVLFEFFSVGGGGTLVDSYTLSANGAVNDNFAKATILSGSAIITSGTSVGATFETAEPYNIGSTGGKSVWWKWTAPSSGTATVATAGSGFDTTLGVYTGTALSSLTKVAANDDVSASVLTSQLSFAAVAGQTYRISVDGYGGASGSITLQLQLKAVPISGSDAFSSRTVLVGANVMAWGANTGATSEPGEPANAGIVGGKSVWWSWTAPANGNVSVSTAGSSFDTTLGIYTGSSVNALSTVVSNDDESSSILSSRVTFTAIAGQSYQISVDGYKGASGQIRLAVVPNNNFANRIPLAGSNISLTGSNVGASLETGEPKNAEVTGGKSVWWSWTAPATGLVSFTTAGSTFDTTLGVYLGSSLTALTAVASNDDETSSILTSRVSFTAVAGQVYQISVDGYKGSSGQISFSIMANNNFARSNALASSTLAVVGSNLGASLESDELKNAGEAWDQSLWWSGIVPAAGLVNNTTNGSWFDTALEFSIVSNVNTLIAVSSNDDENALVRGSRVPFTAVAGQTYHISEDGYQAAARNIASKLAVSPLSNNALTRTNVGASIASEEWLPG